MGGFARKTLESGHQVTLASWEHYEPASHGEALQERAWNASNSRTGLAFYDSTVNFMRNDWAAHNMPTAHGKLGNDNVLLFFHDKTKTWHSADALDVDHITPWKDHLKKLGVSNMAEAHMAYNDVGNLRVIPSVYNRARDSADKIFDTFGADSQQAKAWSDKHFGFDSGASSSVYDPEKDFARRTKATTGQAWTEEHTRADLSFDKHVNGKWFEQELAKTYAGSVQAKSSPDAAPQEVHLFRCAATGQLVTRDALDIDHKIPFEVLLSKMKELYPGGLSKADVLDAYNDTSNLRLVSRGANSSHEWELSKTGEWRDGEKEKPERRNEFRGVFVKGGEHNEEVGRFLAAYKDRTPPVRQSMEQDEPVRILIPRHKGDASGSSDGVVRAVQVNELGHPDNGVFRKVMQEIDRIDPQGVVLPNQTARDNMASSLLVASKALGLPGVDHVVVNDRRDGLIAVSGALDSDARKLAGMSFVEGAQRTVEQNTLALSQLPTPVALPGSGMEKPHSQHV